MRTEIEIKLLGYLGLARKANMAEYGADKIRDMIRNSKLKLVLLASDVSVNTEKRIVNCCKYYPTDYIKTDIDSAKLGKAIGAYGKAAVVGISDKGFSAAIFKLIESDYKSDIRS